MAVRTRWWFLCLGVLALVLVPFALFDEPIREAVERFLRSGGNRPAKAAGIFALLASDIVLPVPSSMVATASGLLLGLPGGAAATWAGMQAGALAGYGLGRLAGERSVCSVVDSANLERAAQAKRRWGSFSLVACRAVPVLAESSVILAGAAQMPLRRFVGLTAASNAAIGIVYATVGSYALERGAFLLAFAASILVPGIAMLAQRAFVAKGAEAQPAGKGEPR